MPKDFLQGASLTPTFEALMVKFGGKIGTLYQMLKNAFKKHPLQNRTNVQIKGGGGQRPFEQCSKKLHFFEMRASLRGEPANTGKHTKATYFGWPWPSPSIFSILDPLILACQVLIPRSIVSVERTLLVAENFHVHDVHSVHIIASRSQLIVAHSGKLGFTEGRQLL